MNYHQAYFKNSISSRLFDICNVLFFLGVGIVMIYPFLNILAISFTDSTEYLKGNVTFYPTKFSLDAYILFFKSNKLVSTALMSVARVVVGTSTSLITTALLAYVCTIRKFSGRKFMRVVFVVTMYFSGGLIPYYLMMLKIGLFNSFLVYVIPGLLSAGYMLLISAYFDNLPEEMAESARIDGCRELGIFFRILLPCSLPVLACIGLYIAVNNWNSWFDTILLNPNGKFDTLQVLLRKLLLQNEAIKAIQDEMMKQSMLKAMTPETLRAATTVVETVPSLITYPFLQKYFIKGMTVGAVKA